MLSLAPLRPLLVLVVLLSHIFLTATTVSSQVVLARDSGTMLTTGEIVSITEEGFVPATVTITVGTAVTWLNSDDVDHRVRSGLPDNDYAIYLPFVFNQATVGLHNTSATTAIGPSEWDSGNLFPTDSFAFTFEQTGTFFYHDPLHPELTGEVVVVPVLEPNQAPLLTIDSPAEGAVVNSTEVMVTGSISDDGAVASILVNGEDASITNGTFAVTLTFTEGGNQLITAVAEDDEGATTIVSQEIAIDVTGPQLHIVSPPQAQAVYTTQPNILIEYDDFYQSVDTSTLAVTLTDENGSSNNITNDLTVTFTEAQGVPSVPLQADMSYTLTVMLADVAANVTTAVSTFYVPNNVGNIDPPVEPDGAGWVTGYVYDSTSCNEYLTICHGLAGVTVTLAQVDVATTQAVRQQREQTILNRWAEDRQQFVPLTPQKMALATPVDGTVVTGPDGFFAFPVAETAVYWLRAELAGYTYAQREVDIVRDHHTATDAIYLTPIDSAVTVCDSSGCSHTNSDGSMTLDIPAGAIAPGDTLEVTATNFEHVEFLPSGSLPEGTWETYAFNLGGDSDYVFQAGFTVTVRIANDKGFAPGTPIPLGYWNPDTLDWEHSGTGVVDPAGQWIEMGITHFSNYDCNDPIADLEEVETEVEDQTDDNDIQECPEGESGCFIPLQSGTLGEEIAPPTVTILGDESGPSLLYNSNRAQPVEVIDFQFMMDADASVQLGDTMNFELFIEGVRTDNFTFEAELQTGEIGRYRYLWNGRNAQGSLLPPGLYDYVAKFGVPYTSQYCYALDGIFGNPPDCENGATGVFVTGISQVNIEGTIDLNTQVDTPYGDGWVLDNVQRLYKDEAGRVLITDGERSVEFYAPNNDLLNQTQTAVSADRARPSLLDPDVMATSTVPAGGTVVSGLIFTDTVWNLAGSPYIVTSTVVVNDNVNLTIDPGVSVLFNAQHSLLVNGSLTAVGTSGNPITFGGLVAGNAGYWGTVQVGGGVVATDGDSSHLSWVTVEDGGATFGAGLTILDSFPTLDNLTLRNHSGQGLSVVQPLRSGTLTVDTMLTEDNGLDGVSLSFGDYILNNITARNNFGVGIGVSTGDSAVTINDSTLTQNVSVARLPLNVVLNNVDMAGNLRQEIQWLGGTLNSSRAWDIEDIAYYTLVDNITVDSSATLTIPPNRTISFIPSSILMVDGALQAVGTATEPITFTTILPGTNYGQIDINSGGGTSQLRYAILRELDGSPAALNIYGTTPLLDWLTIQDSGNDALYVDGSVGLLIHNSSFTGSGGFGLFNNTPANQVDATQNYWDAFSGPFHPTLNPGGAGEQVSDGVLFDPWLTDPPTTPEGLIEDRTADDFTTLTYDEDTDTYIRHYLDGRRAYFDGDGWHTHSVNRVGTVMAYTYNGDGSVATMAITAPDEASSDWVWSFSYSDNQLSAITDPAGRVTAVAIDDHNHLTAITFPDGTEHTFTYNEAGLMTQQGDRAGEITSYTFDSYGRVASVIEPVRPIYDPDSDTVSVMSEVRQFTPSDTSYALLNDSPVGDPANPAPPVPTSGDLVDRVTYGRGSLSGHTNRWGAWLDRTDGVGRVTTYNRDSNNNLTQMNYPDGDCITFTYDSNGNRLSRVALPESECSLPVAQRDGTQGLSWTLTYEPMFNQLKTETDPNGNTTIYVYDYEVGGGDVGNLVELILPTVPDENGQMVTPTITYTYNAWGQVETKTDARGVVERFVYTQGTPDEASTGSNPLFLAGVTPVPGLLTQLIVDSGGSGDLNLTTIYKDFDGAGNAMTRIQPHGATFIYNYDAMNRVIAERDPLNFVTLYEYDARGEPSRITQDPAVDDLPKLNIVTDYTYNLYDQLLHQQTVDGLTQRAESRHYDINRNLATRTDGEGNQTRYRYDDANQQTAVVDALNYVTQFTYNDKGRVSTTIMPDGVVYRQLYDAFDRKVQEIADEGTLNLTTSYIYDDNGNLLQMIDASGAVTCHSYDALNRRLSTTLDCGGLDLTTTFAYDVAGRLVQKTDPRGVITTMSYDDADRLITQRRDAGGLNVEMYYSYDEIGNLLSLTDGRGTVTTYSYDPLGRQLSQRIDPGGLDLLTGYSYDVLGRQTSMTDPNGDTTTTAYSDFGQPTQQIDPLGHVTRYDYDNVGNLLMTTDPTGRTLTFGYDALYRQTRTTNALGDSYYYTYDGRGNQIEVRDPNNHTTQFVYDGVQRLVEMRDALNNSTFYSYDGMGRQTQISEPLGFIYSYDYDPLGRLIEERNPLGERTLHSYDPASYPATTERAIPNGGNAGDGQLTQFVYDGLGRLLSETDPLGHVTAYDYDANGNRILIEDGNDNGTTFAYDAANRLTMITDALNQVTRYQYDDDGQITMIGYQNGDDITYDYDAAGRRVGVNYPDGTSINRTFDNAGRVTAVTAPHTDLTLSYDLVGRPLTIQDHLLNKSIGYRYDARGNRTRLNAPDGLTTSYSYDALDRVEAISQGEATAVFTYDANSRLTQQSFGNGVRVAANYDDAGRTTRLTYRDSSNVLLDRLNYTYDAAGNRTSLTLLNGDVVQYSYDDDNRLVGEVRTGSLSYEQTFVYDAADNRTQRVEGATVVNYIYNPINQLVAETGPAVKAYSYDGRNRLTTLLVDGQTQTFTYDYESQLQQIVNPDGSNVVYDYDAFGRRVAETVAGVTVRYLHDRVGAGSNILGEYDGSSGLVRAYMLAPKVDGRLAQSSGGQTHYYLADIIGSTRYLVSENGTIQNAYQYDAYGQSVSRSEGVINPYQFTGRRWDSAVGLYDYRARTYAPNAGRFVQADPLGQFESPNLYQYGRNNPVNRIDPLGWSSETCDVITLRSDDELGLKVWANRLTSAMRAIPGAPQIRFESGYALEGKRCNKCCESETGADCPGCPKRGNVISANLQANASVTVTWPLAALKIPIGRYDLTLGVEAFAEISGRIQGGGQIDTCQNKTRIHICGAAAIKGGVHAGAKNLDFWVAEFSLYLYAEIRGSCEICISYSLMRGVGIEGTKCNICASAGARVYVDTIWSASYERDIKWVKWCAA